MDRYTLILVADERSPVRRFQIPKIWLKRSLFGLAAAVLVMALASWDYWRVRADNAELAGLRIEAAEQREQIESFEKSLATAQSQLSRVKELERKVRIIANLPGAAGVGGEEVTDLVPEGGDDAAATDELMLPAGVPVEGERYEGQGGGDDDAELPLSDLLPEDARRLALSTRGARHVHGLETRAISMTSVAAQRGDSLEKLLDQLEDKRVKLASMPSIWPARGWLTSRYGPRISPFTGRTQQHRGIDIAGREGTPIVAPAHGRVTFVGRKGPMGNTLVLDHGFGVRTVYGHTREIRVKPGEKVDRGQVIASVGSTGRSTGPHLHYSIEVNGKSRDPLDYIFD